MQEDLNRINEEKSKMQGEADKFYNDMLTENEKLYNQQNEYSDTWEETQRDILNKQLEENTRLIEQQKEKAQKNADTENRKALNDYTAYINPYGYQAERIAENGLSNSGVSETSKLGAYTTYQNRLATANTALQDAITSYDNDINKARLTNDAQLAQNALEKLKMQVEFSQNYYNTKWDANSNKLNTDMNINQTYYNQYQDAVAKDQWERDFAESQRQYNANLAEQQRQYNESLAWQKQQAAQEQANWEKQYNASISTSTKTGSSGGGGSSSSQYSTGVVGYGQLADSYGDGYGNIIYVDKNGNKYKMKAKYNPFTGTKNVDADNGVFSNGYQPDNIGKVKLKATNKTTPVNGINVTIWNANGTYYYWDGKANRYYKCNSSQLKAAGLK